MSDENEIVDGTTTAEPEVLPAKADQGRNGAQQGGVLDEAQPAVRGELARRAQADGALAVTPQVDAAELVARLAVIREAMQSAMQEGLDYGRVPGTDKPTLFKPGSEKLGVLFQLDVQLVNEKHWGPGDHLGVVSRATVYHAPSGARLGYGEGTCSTRERKYAYRRQELRCPQCDATAVIKGKQEYGGGWLCWRKRNGCGATFADGEESIESQSVGEIENPDLPDLWNTVVKMAAKRARIDAVLAVTGASALFSQDMEDKQDSGNPAQDAEQQQALANGSKASDELRRAALGAVVSLLGDREAAARVAERILAEDGYLAVAAGRALCYAASVAGAEQQASGSRDRQPEQPSDSDKDVEQQGAERGGGEQASGDQQRPQGDAAIADSANEFAHLLEVIRLAGYSQPTVKALVELVYDKQGLEALGVDEQRHLRGLLKHGRSGQTSDELLARAVLVGEGKPDRDDARRRLCRWLAERAQGAEPQAA